MTRYLEMANNFQYRSIGVIFRKSIVLEDKVELRDMKRSDHERGCHTCDKQLPLLLLLLLFHHKSKLQQHDRSVAVSSHLVRATPCSPFDRHDTIGGGRGSK